MSSEAKDGKTESTTEVKKENTDAKKKTVKKKAAKKKSSNKKSISLGKLPSSKKASK